MANLPTLVMVLFQFTGDPRWLRDPYRPGRTKGLGPNDAGGFDEATASRIRAEAAAIEDRSRGTPLPCRGSISSVELPTSDGAGGSEGSDGAAGEAFTALRRPSRSTSPSP